MTPNEPGYTAQTGATGEAAFNQRLAEATIAKLKADGVDARYLPGKIDPVGVQGAVFLSIHYDTPGRGVRQSAGPPPTPTGERTTTAGRARAGPRGPPLPGLGAPPGRRHHRQPCRRPELAGLANIPTKRRQIYTRANGARSSFAGVVPANGNPRMMHYYGYYRVSTLRPGADRGRRRRNRFGLPREDGSARAHPRRIGEGLPRPMTRGNPPADAARRPRFVSR